MNCPRRSTTYLWLNLNIHSMLVYTQSYPLMHFLLSYTVIPTNIMQHVYFLVASLHLAPIKLAYTLLSFDSWIYSKPFGEMVSVTFTRFSSVLLNLPFSLLLNIIFVHFWCSVLLSCLMDFPVIGKCHGQKSCLRKEKKRMERKTLFINLRNIALILHFEF